MVREQQPKVTILGTAPDRTVIIYLYAKSPSVNEWNNKKYNTWIYASIRRKWRTRLNMIRRFVKEI